MIKMSHLMMTRLDCWMQQTNEIDQSAMMLKMRMMMLMIDLDCEMNREAEVYPFDPSLVSNFDLLLNDLMSSLDDQHHLLFVIIRTLDQSLLVHLVARRKKIYSSLDKCHLYHVRSSFTHFTSLLLWSVENILSTLIMQHIQVNKKFIYFSHR